MIRDVLSLERLLAMTPSAAAALLTARLSDGRTAHDEAMLEAWLAAGPANAAAWAQIQAAWRDFDDVGDDELLSGMRRWALASRPARRAVQGWQMAAAAVVLLFVGALAVFLVNAPGGGASAPQVASAGSPTRSYVTAPDQRTSVRLADGSDLTLDGGTQVDVAFSADRRDLQLVRGHAFFDVAHDARRPFTVVAGDRQVVAVGTKFDIRLDPGRVRVVLAEGRVRVANPGAAPTLLAAGQQLEAQAGKAPLVSPADIDAVLDWEAGIMVFDDTPLSEVVKVLNRSGPDQFTVSDPAVARLRISGRFRTGDAANFGAALAQIHPVRIKEIAPHRFEIVPIR